MATLPHRSDTPAADAKSVELDCPSRADALSNPNTLNEILRALELIDGVGFWHNAQYLPTIGDLELARFRTAKALLLLDETERARRLEVMRTWAGGQRFCAFCMSDLCSLSGVVVSGGKLLHGSCYREHEIAFSAWIRASIEITEAGRDALAEPSDAA